MRSSLLTSVEDSARDRRAKGHAWGKISTRQDLSLSELAECLALVCR